MQIRYEKEVIEELNVGDRVRIKISESQYLFVILEDYQLMINEYEKKIDDVNGIGESLQVYKREAGFAERRINEGVYEVIEVIKGGKNNG